MSKVDDLVARMRRNPRGVRSADLCGVCDFYFGEARYNRSSHRICKTPWQGDPRVNIQDHEGMAKTHQVRQVLKAIGRLEVEGNAEE